MAEFDPLKEFLELFSPICAAPQGAQTIVREIELDERVEREKWDGEGGETIVREIENREAGEEGE